MRVKSDIKRGSVLCTLVYTEPVKIPDNVPGIEQRLAEVNVVFTENRKKYKKTLEEIAFLIRHSYKYTETKNY